LCCFNNCFSHNLLLFCGSIRTCDHRRFRCGYRSRFWNYRSRNFLCRRFFCLSRRLWSRLWSNLRFRFRNRWQWFNYGWFLLCRRWLNRLHRGRWWLLYRNGWLFNGYRRLLWSHWRLFCGSWRLRLRLRCWRLGLHWHWLRLR
jgi:hypothetical protein